MVLAEQKTIYFAKCAKCGKRAFESFNENSVIKRMKEEGWTEKNGEIFCGTCSKEPTKDNLVLYHGSDLDGVFSAAIIQDEYGKDNVKTIPINYGKEFPYEEINEEVKRIWIVDFSFDDMNELGLNLNFDTPFHGKVIWIDHHESAIRKNKASENWDGVREIGKGACELTWEYVNTWESINSYYKPTLIQYLSAYDVWNKERFDWNDVMNIQYGVRSIVGLDVDKAAYLLRKSEEDETIIQRLKDEGKLILDWIDQVNEGYVKVSAFEGKILGVKAVFMNNNAFNSNTFKSYQGEYEVMVPFRYEKNGLIRFSIYADHNDKVNCAEMAEKFGGGGHAGAAGFQLDSQKPEELNLFIEFLKTKELNAKE